MTSCGDPDGLQVLAPKLVALVVGGRVKGNFVREETRVSLWFLPYYAAA